MGLLRVHRQAGIQTRSYGALEGNSADESGEPPRGAETAAGSCDRERPGRSRRAGKGHDDQRGGDSGGRCRFASECVTGVLHNPDRRCERWGRGLLSSGGVSQAGIPGEGECGETASTAGRQDAGHDRLPVLFWGTSCERSGEVQGLSCPALLVGRRGGGKQSGNGIFRGRRRRIGRLNGLRC